MYRQIDKLKPFWIINELHWSSVKCIENTICIRFLKICIKLYVQNAQIALPEWIGCWSQIINYVQLRLVRCNFPLRAYGNIFILIIRKVELYLIFYKTTEIVQFFYISLISYQLSFHMIWELRKTIQRKNPKAIDTLTFQFLMKAMAIAAHILYWSRFAELVIVIPAFIVYNPLTTIHFGAFFHCLIYVGVCFATFMCLHCLARIWSYDFVFYPICTI